MTMMAVKGKVVLIQMKTVTTFYIQANQTMKLQKDQVNGLAVHVMVLKSGLKKIGGCRSKPGAGI